jgi:CRP-like cAMP-binding protein
LYRIGPYGEEQLAGFKIAGDIFPEGWAFGKTKSTLYYYETIEDSEVVTVEREIFLQLLEDYPEFKQRQFDNLLTNYIGLTLQVSALEQSRATEKILLTIAYLMYRYGEETNTGDYLINVHLTQATFAALTGLSRETASVELQRLRRKGIIHYSSREFRIDPDALYAAINDETISDITIHADVR